MRNKKAKTYNDGVLFAVKCKKSVSDFSARLNTVMSEDIEVVQKMFFKEMSLREQDSAFAESQEKTLSKKVKTRHVSTFSSKNDVMVGNTLYNIVKMDIDRPNKEMYLYLSEVRKIEGWNA